METLYELGEFLFKNIGRLHPRLVSWLEKRLKKIPSINQKIESEYDEMMADPESSVPDAKNYCLFMNDISL